MRELFRNCINTIFPFIENLKEQSCQEKSQSEFRVMGASKTDLLVYGVIQNVIGASLTDISQFLDKSKDPEQEEETNPFQTGEVDTFLLDESDAEINLENESIVLETVEPSMDINDFGALEESFNSPDSDLEIESVGHMLHEIEGTELYHALSGNTSIRERIASLISSVQEKEYSSDTLLSDMSAFLTT